ncbi:Hypothetical protein PENO1_024740 [Penicillium occitanis (nom. inval.)]|nr:hypothetical protein PENOC_035760 [Penicillium occitanis (nom. inval.)]PCH05028.1 Hypothetical protein PENO1_024740 [Penicillium occitanis (nom. inval.)]
MGLIKSALLLGGGIYAVKKVTKSQEKKYEMQKNNNNNQDMYMYGGGHPGQNQQYYQPQPQYQHQQQGPSQGYNYNGTRDGSYLAQDYGNGQSQYGYAGNGHNDVPPAYVSQDEKKRRN